MAFKPTESQKEAISSRGTVLVSAAAGSGKTAVLVKRVVECMLDAKKPVAADRMLVATFTNAAAAEMRARIVDELNDRLKNDKENLLIQRQLLLMPSAKICTIDSFCIELAREFFNLLEISPDFRPVADSARASVSEGVMNALLSAEFEAGEESFLKLLLDIGADFGADKLAKLIQDIHSYCSSLPYPKKWRESAVALYETKPGMKNAPWADVIFDYVADFASAALSDFEQKWRMYKVYPEIETVYAEHTAAITAFLGNVADIAHKKEWDVLRNTLIIPPLPAKAPPFPGKDYPDLVEIKDEWCKFREKTAKAVIGLQGHMPGDLAQQCNFMSAAVPVVKKLMSLVDCFEKLLFEESLEANMIAFSDCARLALTLLDDSSIVADEIRERYDFIMVDEYQDTDKLQDELFVRLSKDKNNLFMVGDIKQSIYKFRHANPESFLEKKNNYKKEAGENQPRKIVLDTNFRSRAGVCNFVNFIFSNVMSEKAGEMEYLEEDELRVGAEFPENSQPAVDMALIEYNKDECERVEAEARYIGKYILDMMDAGAVITDENDRDSLRNARFGDFTILLRSFANRLGVYVGTLRKMGIPVSASFGSVFESYEAKLCLALLKVIANPVRDIPLFAVLTSPLFGFSNEEIAKMRTVHPADSLYATLIKSANGGDTAAQEFIETISKYSRLSVSLKPDELLLLLLEETGLLNMATVMNDGDRRRAGLLSLVHIVGELDYNENAGLSEIIVRLESADAAGVIKNSASAGENTDSVRILTIHSSKGLQFPVCILANAAGKINETDLTQDLIISEKYGIGLKLVDTGARRKYSTALCEAIKISERRAMIAEELRLLYVALTRAQEKLVVCITDTDVQKAASYAAEKLFVTDSGKAEIRPQSVLDSHRYSDWLLMAAALTDGAQQLFTGDFDRISCENFLKIHKADVPSNEPPPLFEKSHEYESEFSPEIVELLKERFAYVYPYKPLNRLPAKIGVSQLAAQQSAEDYSFTALPSFLAPGGLTAAQKGSAVHKFMEFADYTAAESNPQEEIDRLVFDGYLSQEEGTAVRADTIKTFFGSELYQRMKNADKTMREVRFLDEIPAGDIDASLPEEIKNEPVIIQGIADIIFEEDGKLVVVDYKTDRVKHIGELVERYQKQLKIYAKSAEKSYSKEVFECIIYSFSLGKWISF